MNTQKLKILVATIGALVPCMAISLARAETSASDHSGLFKQLDANGDGFVVAKEIEKAKLRLFDRMLRTGDRNDDGRLTPAEFAVSLTPADEPKKRVGMAEATSFAGDGLALEKLIGQLDRNRDGKLSKEEAPPRLRDSFAKLDVDGDGGLDRLEIGKAFAAKARQGGKPGIKTVSDPGAGDDAMPSEEMSSGEMSVEEMSTDDQPATAKPAGGKLSKAAAAPLIAKMLADADRDADGKLSRDEAPPRLKERFEKLDSNGDGFLGRDELIAVARKLGGQ